MESKKIADLHYKKLLLEPKDLAIVEAHEDNYDNITPESLKEVLNLPISEFVSSYFEYSLRTNGLTQDKIDREISNVIFSDSLWLKIFYLSEARVSRFAQLVHLYFEFLNPKSLGNVSDQERNRVEDNLVLNISKFINDNPILTADNIDLTATKVVRDLNASNTVDVMRKHAHFMQYVDAQKAEELGLEFAPLYYFDKGYTDFGLDEKLNALGKTFGLLMQMFIGVNGEEPMSVSDISDNTGLSYSSTYEITKNLIDGVCRKSPTALLSYTSVDNKRILSSYMRKSITILHNMLVYYYNNLKKQASIMEDSEEKLKIYAEVQAGVAGLASLKLQYNCHEITGPEYYAILDEKVLNTVKANLKTNSINPDCMTNDEKHFN